jgi:L-serine dehydratase
MRECVENGCAAEGILPGGLKVKRRAPALFRTLAAAAPDAGPGNPSPAQAPADPLLAMEWVNLFALAVNEENAAGGRIVTAPTNGAAGIIPAVLHYYVKFVPGANDDGVVRFLLAAGAVGILFKINASISGAEVGCQGEVGSACSMAAAGLCEVLGGTPGAGRNAAEVGIEHNLGPHLRPGRRARADSRASSVTPSPRQGHHRRAPCLQRDGSHTGLPRQAIKTMRETGADMKSSTRKPQRRRSP